MEDKKSLIYNCAKELFSKNGFRNTSVSDITKKAGIAVGTFYIYYPSKEKLFMDIFMDENIKLKRKCMESVDLTKSPLEIVRQMLSMNAEGMRSNPILNEWNNRAVFSKIEQLYMEENGSQVADFIFDNFHGLIKKWQDEGKIRRDIDSRIIMMIFAAIINIDTHKEEIGPEYFPQLLYYMTELIMLGLSDCPA